LKPYVAILNLPLTYTLLNTIHGTMHVETVFNRHYTKTQVFNPIVSLYESVLNAVVLGVIVWKM
jgi:hypothetical protein